jgi:hypothetical protein
MRRLILACGSRPSTSSRRLPRAGGAILFSAKGDCLPSLPNMPFTESVAASVDHYFRDGWHLRDDRERGVELMIRRRVYDDLDISSIDQIMRHPYYQEFLAPHGLRWFAGVKVASGEDIWGLSIQRTIGQGPFSEGEKQLLAAVSDRLSASAALARALGAATATGALQAFELSGKAVVLINRNGEAYRVNKSAEALLRGDVKIERRKLVASDPVATSALNRALHELMWRRIGGGLSHPVALPRHNKRPILAYPVKLENSAANALADCQALVILIDLDQQPRLPEMVLRSAFGMTAAEARLAGRLAAGESLEFATEQIGIPHARAPILMALNFFTSRIFRALSIVLNGIGDPIRTAFLTPRIEKYSIMLT